MHMAPCFRTRRIRLRFEPSKSASFPQGTAPALSKMPPMPSGTSPTVCFDDSRWLIEAREADTGQKGRSEMTEARHPLDGVGYGSHLVSAGEPAREKGEDGRTVINHTMRARQIHHPQSIWAKR